MNRIKDFWYKYSKSVTLILAIILASILILMAWTTLQKTIENQEEIKIAQTETKVTQTQIQKTLKEIEKQSISSHDDVVKLSQQNRADHEALAAQPCQVIYQAKPQEIMFLPNVFDPLPTNNPNANPRSNR